jgi:hypothetical protein
MDSYLKLFQLRENLYRAEADFWRASQAYLVEKDNEELREQARLSGGNYAEALIEIENCLNNLPPGVEVERELSLMRRFSTILRREMALMM